jgi:uncharacterized protein
MNVKSLVKNGGGWLKNTLRNLFILRATTHEIALGAAIGMFIGIFPTFGFGGLIVLGLAPLIRFNASAAFITGSLFSNPLFAPLWIFLSCLIVGIDFSMIKSSEGSIGMLIKHYSWVISMYVLGNAIISTVAALVLYGLTYALVVAYRKRRSKNDATANKNDSMTK